MAYVHLGILYSDLTLSVSLAAKDVPLQGNPAYEALETIIQTSQTLEQEHRLKPLDGTGEIELCK